MAGSFPTPIFYMDVRDKGTKSIKKMQAGKNSKVFRVTSWADLQEAYWYLNANPGKFKTVVLDTVTQLQDLCLKYAKGGGEGISKTSQQKWGDVAEQMKTWIMNFRDLPMHVVYVCQDRLDSSDGNLDDDGDLNPEIGPAVIPSVGKILAACVDIIAQTFIRETVKKKKVAGKVKSEEVIEFCARIGPHPIYLTKFRLDKSSPVTVPPILIDPTYDKFMELLERKE